MARRQSQRHSQSEWKRLVSAWRASGLSAREFSQRHRVTEGTLRWWAWRLPRAVGGSVSRRRENDVRQERPRFVPLTIVPADGVEDEARAEGSAESWVEVILASGTRIRVGAGFEQQTLSRVLRALESEPRC